MFKSLIFFFFLFFPLWALGSSIHQIEIKGNELVSKKLILSNLTSKKGENYSKEKVKEDVKRLFTLGLFEDVKADRFLEQKGWRLVFTFKERVFIKSVEFEGVDAISEKDLKELSELEEFEFLDSIKLKKTYSKLKEKYEEKGYYFAKFSHEIEKQGEEKKDNKLKVIVEEGDKLYIQKISFIGNRSLSSQYLKNLLSSREKSFISFFSSSGTYKPESAERDRQVLEFIYGDKGFLGVKVYPPKLIISEDQKSLEMSFRVDEGERMKVGQVLFPGDEIVDQDLGQRVVSLKQGEWFSISQLQKDVQALSRLYKNEGYAFAQVQPLYFSDPRSQNTLHIRFSTTPGEKYSVRDTHIKGNKSTRDKVVFRYLRLKELDIFNEDKRLLSEQLLQQLGYFESVKITPLATDEERMLDLEVNLKERERLGEMGVALGYNTYRKLSVEARLKKDNFLGLDQSVSLHISFDTYSEHLSARWSKPYFLDSNWNLNFNVFNVNQNSLRGGSGLFSSQENYYYYYQLNTGFSTSLGRYITNFSSLSLEYRLQRQTLKETHVSFLRDLPVLSSALDKVFGEIEEGREEKIFSDIFDDLEGASGINSSLALIFKHDTRNDRYYSKKGMLGRLSFEYSGLGGDFNYFKFIGSYRHFYNPFWKLVVKNRFEYGYLSGNKGGDPLFTELFLLGGPSSLRGYQPSTQGPKKKSEKAKRHAEKEKFKNPEEFARRPYGGSQMFLYSLELEVPIIETGLEVRATAFFDIGEANDKFQFQFKDQLRSNVGVGLRLRSPFGPMRVDFAIPTPSQYLPEEERGWEIQFNIETL